MSSESNLSSDSHADVVSMSEKCSSDDVTPRRDRTQTSIAIVGMGCRLPGHSNSPTALWDLLERGGVSKNEPPPSRFSLAGHYDKDNPGRPRTMKSPGGMFIEDVDPALFDGQFFNISHAECIAMDPQQRQLLEVAYECLENGGCPMEKLSGSKTGVVVGTNFVDYGAIQHRDPENRAESVMIGLAPALLSGRVSHFLNIHGPSMTVDTACSAGLVSLDVACRYLDTFQADAMLVGGANLWLGPEHNQEIGMMHVAQSGSGLSKSFDSSADGYIKAEGVNCFFLKRLDDAVANGDPIRAIIRGTAVNASGRTNGIANPSSDAQAAVTRQAMKNAGIEDQDFAKTRYLEAHGTGTLAGDPIEARGAASVFSKSREVNQELVIGSIKSNIGHSEPAAGLSGLLKATMVVEKGIIPGTPTFVSPNPNIDWKGLRLKASRMSMSWPKVDVDNIRRAGVNSFGFGGANAHVVVENDARGLSRHVSSYKQLTNDFFDDDDEEDDWDEQQDDQTQQPPKLLFFSANDLSSLDECIKNFNSHLQNPLVSLQLDDLAYTLSERRSRHYHGAFAITMANPKFIDQETLLRGKQTSTAPRIAFVFTGQGAQWSQMGADLIKHFPLARSTIEYLDSVLQSVPSPPAWSLLEELTADRSTEALRQPEFSQPLVTALQIALLQVLEEWRVFPEAVIGHSSGEIAAAYAANLLSSSDAIKVAYYRGQSSKNKASIDRVGMLAVGIDEATLSEYLEQKENKIQVACYNSPSSLTLSGLVSELEELRDKLQTDGHFARLLLVNLAYHSDYMAEIGEMYETLLHNDGLFRKSTMHQSKINKPVVMYSSVTGAVVDPDTTLGIDYWKQNMVSPVRFSSAMEALLKQSNADFLIELGPSNALAGPIAQIKKGLDIDGQYTSALKRQSDSIMPMYEAAGKLFLAGDRQVSLAKVNRVNAQTSKVIVDLPNYVWNHSTRYWHETRASKDWRFKKFINHDLIGSKISSVGWHAPIFKANLKLAYLPWLRDHKLGTDVVFPATGYIAMAAEAMYQTAMVTKWKHNAPSRYRVRLRDVKLLRALLLAEDKETTVSFALTPIKGSSWYEYQMCSEQEGVDVDLIHSTGLVCVETDYKDISKSVEPLELALSARQWYKTMAEMGYSFGPSFQKHLAVESTMGQRHNRSMIDLEPPPSQPEGQSWYPLHPAVLDGCFQATTPSLWKGHLPQSGAPVLVPKAIESVIIESGSWRKERVSTKGIAYASANFLGVGDIENARNYSTSVDLHDPADGSLIFQMRGLEWAEMEMNNDQKPPHQFMRVDWDADIDMLMQDETLAGTSWLDTKTIQQIIDLIVHKKPGLSVLEVNLSILDGSNFWMEQGKDQSDNPVRSSCSQYHFAVREAKTLIQAQERFNSRAMRPQFHLVMDITKPATITEVDSIDLAIVNPGNDELQDLNEFLKSLVSSIKNGGFIVANGLARIDSLGRTIHLSNGVSICRVEKQTRTATSIGIEVGIPVQDFTRVSLLDEAAQASISDEVLELMDDLARKWRFQHSHNPLEDISSNTGLVVVLDELFASVMQSIDEKQWELLKYLVKMRRPLLWITHRSADPTRAAAVGFLATIRAEEQAPFFTLDVEASNGRATTNAISACLQRIWNTTSAKTFEPRESTDYDFIERGGVVYVSRIRTDSGLTFGQSSNPSDRKTEVADFHASETVIRSRCERLGNLDSVHFGEVDLDSSLFLEDTVEVEIQAAGITYEDVAIALGTAPGDEFALGREAAGVITKVAQGISELSVGDRVVVFGKGCIANRIGTVPARVHRIPDSLSFEEAATLPSPYLTAIHALLEHTSLSVGKSVLIHSATESVGIAAIHIAQYVGAKVYATVDSPEKKDFLTSTFGLMDDHVLHSRNAGFGDQILSATNSKGFDVILLNSLAGDMFDESFRVLADGGALVELGKRDVLDRISLPMTPFNRNSTFKTVDLSTDNVSDIIVSRLMRKLFELIEGGFIKPISPVHKFPWNDVPAALRFLRLGTHVGKVVVSQDNPASGVQVPVRRAPKILGLKANRCYLIVSSLRGLCGDLAIYLATQGAKHLAVLSRSGYADEKSRHVIKQVRALGCQIDLLIADVTNSEAVTKAMQETTVPIVGIIQGAMVLRDRPIESMTLTEYHEALQCKIKGTWNLHNSAEALGLELDSFTMLSSLSGIIGHAAQANYAAGNVFLDAFAAWRQARGLPACSIDLGISEDAGVIAESAKLQSSTEKRMFRSLNHGQLRKILYFAMLQQKDTPPASKIASVCELAFSPIVTGLTFPQQADSILKSDARFLPLFSSNEGSRDLEPSGENANADIQELFLLLRTKSADPAARLKALILAVSGCFTRVLRLSEPMDPERPLSIYGTDSLAAVEVRNWVRTELGCLVTTLDIMNATSLRFFCEKILTKLLASETIS